MIRKSSITVRVHVGIPDRTLLDRIGSLSKSRTRGKVLFLHNVQNANPNAKFFGRIRINSNEESVVDGVNGFVHTANALTTRS